MIERLQIMPVNGSGISAEVHRHCLFDKLYIFFLISNQCEDHSDHERRKQIRHPDRFRPDQIHADAGDQDVPDQGNVAG